MAKLPQTGCSRTKRLLIPAERCKHDVAPSDLPCLWPIGGSRGFSIDEIWIQTRNTKLSTNPHTELTWLVFTNQHMLQILYDFNE